MKKRKLNKRKLAAFIAKAACMAGLIWLEVYLLTDGIATHATSYFWRP